MKLKTYIKEHHVSITDLAKELGYTRPHLTSVINGKTPPGRKLIIALVKWSKGEVKADDLI